VYNALLEETLAWQFIEDLKKDGRNFRRAGGIFAAEGLSMLEEANILMDSTIDFSKECDDVINTINMFSREHDGITVCLGMFR
jgi:hypothetical protein